MIDWLSKLTEVKRSPKLLIPYVTPIALGEADWNRLGQWTGCITLNGHYLEGTELNRTKVPRAIETCNRVNLVLTIHWACWKRSGKIRPGFVEAGRLTDKGRKQEVAELNDVMGKLHSQLGDNRGLFKHFVLENDGVVDLSADSSALEELMGVVKHYFPEVTMHGYRVGSKWFPGHEHDVRLSHILYRLSRESLAETVWSTPHEPWPAIGAEYISTPIGDRFIFDSSRHPIIDWIVGDSIRQDKQIPCAVLWPEPGNVNQMNVSQEHWWCFYCGTVGIPWRSELPREIGR